MIIPHHISEIIARVEKAGFEIYAVGGCVRDTIMGKQPSDWDMTTSALPEDILSIFSDKQTLTMGIKHGTVTVLWDGTPVEITTYRIDGAYSDSRHPQQVTFARNLTEDLKRRDFTVNSIAYNPKSGITDPLSGTSDIHSKVIRAVGEPQKCFREDALRIMRAIRFSAVLDFTIEENTSDAIFLCGNLLKNIARERITEEFTKTITAPNPCAVLTEYFTVTAPVFFDNDLVSGEIIPDFTPLNLLSPHTVPRLAAYLYCTAAAFRQSTENIARCFFSEMRFSTDIKNTTNAILRLADTEIPPCPITLKKLMSANGPSAIFNTLSVLQALSPENPYLPKAEALAREIIDTNQCFTISSLDVDGSELIREFQLSGREIGTALAFLLNAVIEEKCRNEKDALINYFKSASETQY